MITEGVDMRVFAVLLSAVIGFTFCVGLCLAFFWGRRWATKAARAGGQAPPPRPAAPAEKNTHSEFIDSMQAAHKRLEAALARAEVAEQKLNRLAPHADAGKPDSYATAAFLLANGEGVDHVARRLNLSPTQVRLVQKLRQELEEKTDAGPKDQEERAVRVHKGWEKNGVGYGENIAVGQNGARFLAK